MLLPIINFSINYVLWTNSNDVITIMYSSCIQELFAMILEASFHMFRDNERPTNSF